MAEAVPKILEGVFAISKPPSLSSAQVLRELQSTFEASTTFAPLLEDTRRKEEEQRRHSKKRRRGNDAPFKMGHGGTLDPMATGVLIVGIGRGTKHLQNFLGCSKTYDTVVLFGKDTDTYDVAGRIVGEADFKHITRELVDSKLGQFRGKIRQVPPIYSALKINGMKAYEYAREGKELPRELESREMQVDECTLLEWFEGGEHDYRWPAEEVSPEEKQAVSKLMDAAGGSTTLNNAPLPETEAQEQQPTQTQESPSQEAAESTTAPKQTSPAPTMTKASKHTHDSSLNLSEHPSPSPAALIRLTVSSGFYVRSFAHDLGHACSSMGIMATLLRSRQATFTTVDPAPEDLVPALTYADLCAGESTWGPKISAQLERWIAENPAKDTGHVNGRDPDTRRQMADERGQRPKQRFRGEWTADTKGERRTQAGGKWKGKWNEGGNRGRMHERVGGGLGQGQEKRERQRNSSSPE